MGVQKKKDQNKMSKIPIPEELKNAEEFGYLNLHKRQKNHADLRDEEDPKAKMIRKVSENPFVPIGLAVTTFALLNGVYAMMRKNSKKSQQMMRLRVGAQGFTVIALLAGVLYAGKKPAP